MIKQNSSRLKKDNHLLKNIPSTKNKNKNENKTPKKYEKLI